MGPNLGAKSRFNPRRATQARWKTLTIFGYTSELGERKVFQIIFLTLINSFELGSLLTAGLLYVKMNQIFGVSMLKISIKEYSI